MSQRRGAGSVKQESSDKGVVEIPNNKNVNQNSDASMDSVSTKPLEPHQSGHRGSERKGSFVDGVDSPSPILSSSVVSLDERYLAESQQLKTKQWQECHFARGFTEATWEAEYAKYKDDWKGECSKMVDNKNDSVPCGCCSAVVCSALGAGRVGNMVVLKQSTEWVTEEVPDEENPGGTKMKRYTQPRLDCVLGPYWPMLCMVTYPLILGVSGVTLVTVIPKSNPLIAIGWGVCSVTLLFALSCTAFREPGILARHIDPPSGQEENQWRWNDRAHSYRPRGAWYDPDTAVIVEGFDHTCPWTGTAIGKKNMLAFQCFVFLIFVCLIFDIILLTGGI